MAKKKIFIFLLVLVVIFVMGTVNCLTVNLDNLYNFRKLEADLSYTADVAESLKVDNQTGHIALRTAKVDDVRLRTIYTVDAETQAAVDELMGNIKINAIIDGGVFKINVLSKKDNTDYWTWKTNTYPLSSVQIDFAIVVPEKFKSFDLNTLTGNINVSSINGALKANTYTGDINIIDANIVGDNVIDVKTGDITTEAVINQADKLSLTTMTGNIKLSIPGDTGVSINASLMTGNIKGNFGGMLVGEKDLAGMSTASKVYNNGGTDVTLKTMTGDITVNELK